jgi:hypothetical protein
MPIERATAGDLSARDVNVVVSISIKVRRGKAEMPSPAMMKLPTVLGWRQL